MLRSHITMYRNKLPGVLLVSLIMLVGGCTHLALEDCGGEVLGANKPRIRSSHFRMFLADLPAATEKFLAFAAMSSLSYAEDQDCGTPLEEIKISLKDREKLEEILHGRGWQEIRDPLWIPPCEDDVGLYFRVWERNTDANKEVVIAFRGTTWGGKDWVYGNAHWFTRFLPMEDQYSRARALVEKIFQHYEGQTKEQPHYFTTGHSLGGGLAQHILYSNPKVVQAIAFDPSSVTGFSDQTVENKIAGCSCVDSVPDGEPRIYRVYAAYEILSNMRIFHKIFFPPERHVQEIRFPNERSHSMLGLTEYLSMNASSEQVQDIPWFRGVGELSPGVSCTSAFIKAQKGSCSVQVSKDSWSKCPQ